MSTLGIGTRVWIGWVPDDDSSAWYDGRTQTGTIIEGPFRDGEIKKDLYTGEIKKVSGTHWNVSLDSGGAVGAHESILFPIDGDETERTERREEVTT